MCGFRSRCGIFVRTRHRHQPRNGSILVEQIWPAVYRRYPQEKGQPDVRILKLAVAFGRGVHEDQRWDALSLAGCRSRRGSPGKLCHKAPRSLGSLETPQKNYETPWSRTYLRHRQATFLRCAMKVIGNVDKQETGCWFNNRAENSHQPFRRRERVTLRFRRRFRSIKY